MIPPPSCRREYAVINQIYKVNNGQLCVHTILPTSVRHLFRLLASDINLVVVTLECWNIVGIASSVNINFLLGYNCGAITYLGSTTTYFSSKCCLQIFACLAGLCTSFIVANQALILSGRFHGNEKNDIPGSVFSDVLQFGAQQVGIIMFFSGSKYTNCQN